MTFQLLPPNDLDSSPFGFDYDIKIGLRPPLFTGEVTDILFVILMKLAHYTDHSRNNVYHLRWLTYAMKTMNWAYPICKS